MKKAILQRWQKVVLHLLGKEDPPEKVAAAFALGVGIAFSPFLGFHTLIALGLAFLFKLSKLDVLLGTFVVNPWNMVPIYSFAYWIGTRVLKLLNLSPAGKPRLEWSGILHRSFWMALRAQGHRSLATWFVGTLLLSAGSAAVTYWLVRAIILHHEKRHPHLSARRRRQKEPEAAAIRSGQTHES